MEMQIEEPELVGCPCVCHRYAREFRIGPACDCVLRGGCVKGKVKKNVPTALQEAQHQLEESGIEPPTGVPEHLLPTPAEIHGIGKEEP